MSIKDFIVLWNRFFFAPVSPLPIALYRIIFGLLVLADALLLAPDLMVWFGPHGVLTPATALQLTGPHRLNLFLLFPPGPGPVYLLFGLLTASSITLACGFFSRTSAALVYLTLVSFTHRNPLILHSGDTLLRISAFFLIFSRSGTCLSLDRWLLTRWNPSPPPIPLIPAWPGRLIQIQLCLVYLATALWKFQGSMWLDGTALYYTSRLQEFWRFRVPYIFEHLWTIKLATYATLVIEFSLGTLVWIKELRHPILAAGLLLHLGIEYSMNIPLFAFTMTSGYVLFLNGTDLVRWFPALRPFSPSNSLT